MNELNTASLSASKKLYEAGIVLETDCIWCQYIEGFRLIAVTELHPLVEVIPAPCFTDVWRELPFQSYIKKLDDGSTLVWICDDDADGKYIESNMIANTNPTDALIDLLIWLKGEGNDRRRQKDCG